MATEEYETHEHDVLVIGAGGADDQDVVLVCLVRFGRHQMILQSWMIPMETSRM